MKKFILAGVAMTAIVMLAAPTLTQAAKNEGWNYVPVDACKDIDGGIMIARSGAHYRTTLMNGSYDAGNGTRDYTFRCRTSNMYFVTWQEVVQPMFDEMYAYNDAYQYPNDTLAHTFSSYADYDTYFELPTQPISIPEDAEKFSVNAELTDDHDATILYSVHSASDAPVQFSQEEVVNAIANDSFVSDLSLYRADYAGQYVTVFAYVTNDDGISGVENLNKEVDDIMALNFYVPVITSCGDSAGGNGLYSACIGDTVHHDGGLTFTVLDYTDDELTLSVVDSITPYAFTTHLQINKSGWYPMANSWYRIEFHIASDVYGAFFLLDQITW